MSEDKINERNTDKQLEEAIEDSKEFQPSSKEDELFSNASSEMTKSGLTQTRVPEIKNIKSIEDTVPVVEDENLESDTNVETEEKLVPGEDQPGVATCTPIDGGGDRHIRQIKPVPSKLTGSEVNAEEVIVKGDGNCDIEPAIESIGPPSLRQMITPTRVFKDGPSEHFTKDIIESGPKGVARDKRAEKKGTPPVYAEVRDALAKAQAANKFLITVSYPNPKKEGSFEHFFAVHEYPTDDIKGTMAHLTKDLTTKLKLDSTPKGDLLGIDHWK
jgi:hypothetical protein